MESYAAKSAIICLQSLQVKDSRQLTHTHLHTNINYLHIQLHHEQQLCRSKVKWSMHISAGAFNSHSGPEECSVQLPSPQQEMAEVLL